MNNAAVLEKRDGNDMRGGIGLVPFGVTHASVEASEPARVLLSSGRVKKKGGEGKS